MYPTFIFDCHSERALAGDEESINIMLKKYFTLPKIISFFTFLLFFLPILVSTNSPNPFIFIKAIWLQVITTIIFGLYLVFLLFYWKNYRPRFSLLGIAALLFYLAIFTSSFLGVDFWRSFWSRYERMTGLFIMLHYGILFLVWRSVLNKDQWQKLWKLFVGIGNVVLLVAVYQLINPKFLLNIGSARVSSTLGNPIYVAGFCLFMFFSALIFWQRTQTKLKWLWLFEAGMSVVALFATQTRGDMIGLWVGLVFLCAGLLLDKDFRSKYKKISIAAISILLFIPLLVLLIKQVPAARVLPVIGRFVSVPLDQSTGGTRLVFWKVAINGWKENKILGWGWDNFYTLADKNYLPELIRYGRSEEWSDNAHNIIFNTLATTGVAGLSAYFLVYFLLYYSLLKKYKQEDINDRFLIISLLALFTAHFVQNLFVFENLSSYLFLFWLIAGVDVCFNNSSSFALTPTPTGSKSFIFKKLDNRLIHYFGRVVQILFVLLVGLSSFILLYKFSYIPAKADSLEAQAVKQAMVDFKGSLDIHRAAIKFESNPYRPEIAYDFGNFILTWLDSNKDFPFTDYRALAQEMYVVGVKAMQSYLSDYPRDVAAGSTLARAYQDGYEFWQNPGYLDIAEKQYNETLRYSPRRQTVLYGLARVYLLQDKNDEAIKTVQRAINDAPNVPDSHWMLALVYLNKNDRENAYLSTKKAFDLGYNFNGNDLVVVLDLLKSHNEGLIIEPMIKQVIYSSNGGNKALVRTYIDYLNSEKRSSEASEFAKYLQ